MKNQEETGKVIIVNIWKNQEVILCQKQPFTIWGAK